MKAEIYTKPNCGWCVRAKSLLKARAIPYSEQIVGVDVSKSDIQQKVNALVTGVTVSTVPQIFLDGVYVGGFSELNAKLG